MNNKKEIKNLISGFEYYIMCIVRTQVEKWKIKDIIT
jgi:hypothetical protein